MVASIKARYTEIYGVNDANARFGSIDISVGDINHGKPTMRQLELNGPSVLIYPVTARVEMEVHYSNNPTVAHFTRGQKSDEVFLFYKDAFGKWIFKTGSL